jgi:hypothetical protein
MSRLSIMIKGYQSSRNKCISSSPGKQEKNRHSSSYDKGIRKKSPSFKAAPNKKAADL